MTKKKDKRKSLVMSYSFPPITTASSNVIASIVKFLSKDDICILRGDPKGKNAGAIVDDDSKLDILQYICDVPRFLKKRSFKISLPVYLNHLWIIVVILKGLKIIRKNKIENIFALFPNHYYIIAAYFIQKITKLPLIIYWVDVYQEGRPHFFEKWVANYFEKRILASAKKNFVMTPFLRDHLSKKHWIETEVLPIPTELTTYSSDKDEIPKNDGEIQIVFTGSIYDAQLDAIVNLINALKLIDEYNLKLLLITPASKEGLKKHGIVTGRNISIRTTNRNECITLQRQADILFLPLAFNCPDPLVVKLSLPSKVLEYFSAGKPILVHAPADSYIASYAKEKGFAMVVDKPDPLELKKAIISILNNQIVRDNIVENAKSTLLEHDARKISEIIKDTLQL